MENNLIFFLFILVIHSLPLLSQIQWADRVINFSTQLGIKQFSAKQALGKPSVLPTFGFSPCAWAPRNVRSRNEEFLYLGFAQPRPVKTIIINLNNSPNCISKIFLFDSKGNKFLVYQKNVSEYPKTKGVLFKHIIEKTTYEAFSILVYFNTEILSDFLQVDAVGISEADESQYEIKIKEINIQQEEIKEPINLGLNVNSPYHELAPIITSDGRRLYFTREAHPANFGIQKRQDIWFSDVDETGEFQPSQILPPPINNEQHNFAFAVSSDGNAILLGNVYRRDGTMDRGISISRFNGLEWEFPQKLEIEDLDNLNEKTAISLAANGKVLILSIEGLDSFGGLDLYVSFLKDDGKWSKPKNLGPMINTADDDTSPFLAYDNVTLYFSSSGYPGYGSLDIFVTKRLDSSWEKWSEPINIGSIINTSSWDAYFTIPASGDYGYFVSTNNSYGKEDIFKIYLPKHLRPEPVVLISGKVLNKKTNQPLGATIQYETLPDGKVVGIARSNPLTGEYRIVLPGGAKYGFLATADSFLSINENIDIRYELRYQEIIKDLFLVPIEIGESIRLNNIFFEYNDYKLLPDSYSELNRLVKLLDENPALVVEISGHTDNIGSTSYNLNLSIKRAEEIANYLFENGIKKDRIIVRGFGEKLPIASNDTEVGRKMNRRVEFKIIKK
ncbi:MAG: OmpA family protein [Candidatus Kapaibacteriales bacterium]